MERPGESREECVNRGTTHHDDEQMIKFQMS